MSLSSLSCPVVSCASACNSLASARANITAAKSIGGQPKGMDNGFTSTSVWPMLNFNSDAAGTVHATLCHIHSHTHTQLRSDFSTAFPLLLLLMRVMIPVLGLTARYEE